MKTIPKSGCRASRHNRKIVEEAILKHRANDPLEPLNKVDVMRETGLSYVTVLKYVKEIEGGK